MKWGRGAMLCKIKCLEGTTSKYKINIYFYLYFADRSSQYIYLNINPYRTNVENRVSS